METEQKTRDYFDFLFEDTDARERAARELKELCKPRIEHLSPIKRGENMIIEGCAKEIADFFALGYYSSAHFKIEVERVPDAFNNGSASIAEKFPSEPPKHGEDCRPTWQGAVD